MKKLVLLSLIFLIGCVADTAPPKPEEFVSQGYVRNVWERNGDFDVVFEHDSGAMSVMTFYNHPALWAGEHFRIHYHKENQNWPGFVLDSSERMPR